MGPRKPTWSNDRSSSDEEADPSLRRGRGRPSRSSQRNLPQNQDREEDDNFNLTAPTNQQVSRDEMNPEQVAEQEQEQNSSKRRGRGKNSKCATSASAAPIASTSTFNTEKQDENRNQPDRRRVSVSSSSSTTRPGDASAASAAINSTNSSKVGKKKRKKDDEDETEKVKKNRAVVACDTCRKKKTKCDGNGEEPCSLCIKFEDDCVYNSPWDKSAYSRRYVDSLEARLKRMEQALELATTSGSFNPGSQYQVSTGTYRTQQQNLERRQPLRNTSGPPQTSPSASFYASSNNLPTTLSFADEAADLPDLPPLGTSNGALTPATSAAPSRPVSSLEGPGSLVSTWPGNTAGRLQMDENGSLRYLGPSASVTLFLDAHNALGSQSASRALELAMLPPDSSAGSDELLWLTSSLGMSLSNVLPSAETVTFPPYDLSSMLVRVYFDKIHPVFPVLDSREFTLKYEELYSRPRSSSNADPGFLAILFAVFACASRAVKDPRVCPEGKEAEKFGYASKTTGKEEPVNYSLAGISYFARAQVLSLHRFTHTRLEMVQCSSLLAFYMAQCNCSAKSWLLCGAALRAAIDLGLHRDIQHLQLSYFEVSMRRHVFWNIYVLDRLLSISLGRPFSIEDDNIDAQLPGLEPQPPFPLNVGFSSVVKLQRLNGSISRTANRLEQARHRGDDQEASRLRNLALQHENELNQWFQELPEHLKSGRHEAGSPLAVQSTICFSIYQSATMVLHRSLLQDDILTSGASEQDAAFSESKVYLAKCTRTALMVIKAAPRIASSMPPSHYLLEFAQQLLVAGGFLAINVIKHSSSNADQLLGEADEAVAGLRLLEESLPGARNLRRALMRLLKSLRSRLGMRQKSGAITPSASRPQSSNASLRRVHPPDFRDVSPSAITPMSNGGQGQTSHSPEIARNPAMEGAQSNSPFPGGTPSFGMPSSNSGPSNDAALDAALLEFSNSTVESWSGLDWLNGLLGENPPAPGATPTANQNQMFQAQDEGNGNETVDFSAALWDVDGVDALGSVKGPAMDEVVGDSSASKGKERDTS